MCAGNELFFVSLYLMKWISTPMGIGPFGMKNLTWPLLMAYCSCPVSVVKNAINVVQLWKASKILVGVDLAERAAARNGPKQQ